MRSGFLRTGHYYTTVGVISGHFNGGYWWTGVRMLNIAAHDLNTDHGEVLYQQVNNRGHGFAIRCVIREG